MVRSSTEVVPPHPLERDEALSRADWAVRERFGLPPASTWLGDANEVTDESLRLIGEEHAAAGEFEFTWERTGIRYEARVSQAEGDVEMIWIRRLDLSP